MAGMLNSAAPTRIGIGIGILRSGCCKELVNLLATRNDRPIDGGTAMSGPRQTDRHRADLMPPNLAPPGSAWLHWSSREATRASPKQSTTQRPLGPTMTCDASSVIHVAKRTIRLESLECVAIGASAVAVRVMSVDLSPDFASETEDARPMMSVRARAGVLGAPLVDTRGADTVEARPGDPAVAMAAQNPQRPIRNSANEKEETTMQTSKDDLPWYSHSESAALSDLLLDKRKTSQDRAWHASVPEITLDHIARR
ncbi:hypothetical protein HETIRDRAFT_452169 [Heterobasidion irregulare TC 32-1]|uniref:Uncharacterized protein n=1 Tax=Heterobasidion irregulare (strain TC 32-1) TaxID=747525 RepID=W4K467_HETIT|nr:uncharacterized protein HETIRDRAFT_452169 [Heterobasidion irregulare TC 32-1]ETW80607.1 hypothetical protein HETIRDRAFT_452169 [Heterobasidion irregulare TC 32-1]